MATFRSPFGGVTVEVPEGSEPAYEAAGWPVVETPTQEPAKRSPGRPPKSSK